MITAQDILDLLPIVADRNFEPRANGALRDEDDRCPLCALAHEIDPRIDYYSSAWSAMAVLFEIHTCQVNSVIDIDSIIYAADGPRGPWRQALEKALGL